MKNIELDISRKVSKLNDHIKDFDPSYAMRYMIITELIKEIEKKINRKLKILDVGGYNGAVQDFLPDNDITIVDLVEDKGAKNYIQVDGTKLPFEDGSFDIVISSDVLEHVRQDGRTVFIEEILRVSNDYLILCAPFGTENVIRAEKLCDNFYESMTNESYIWLKEHRELVLPKKQWLNGLLKNKIASLVNFSHTSVDLWSLMLCSNFFLAGNVAAIDEGLAAELSIMNEKYLNDIAGIDFPEDGYRTFFVASKKSNIKVITPKYDQDKIFEFIEKDLIVTGRVLSEITRILGLLLNDNESFRNITKENAILKSELFAIKNSRKYKISKQISDIKERILGKKQ